MKFSKEPDLKIGECSVSVLHQLMKASCAIPIIQVPNNADEKPRKEALEIAQRIADGAEFGFLPDNMKLVWGWH